MEWKEQALDHELASGLSSVLRYFGKDYGKSLHLPSVVTSGRELR